MANICNALKVCQAFNLIKNPFVICIDQFGCFTAKGKKNAAR